MKIRNITSLSLLLFSSSLVHTMELVEQNAVSSANDLKLYTNQRDFYVEDENAAYRVEKHNMNPLLRAIAQHKALEKFVGDGYIRINKDEGGKYALLAKVRGNGGGPISGAIAYWATKTLCYGTAAAAATTAVVATGGAAGALTGALVAGTTAGATTGATVVAGAIVGAGYASEAATLTAAVVTSSGGIAGTIAAVETGSLAAAAFFTAIPFLP